MTELEVFLPYGRQAGSARVRVFEWLERTRVEAAIHDYVGGHDARAGTVLRHPLGALRAERAIRRACASVPARVLVHTQISPLSNGSAEACLLRGAAHSVFDFDDGLQWDWGEQHLLRRLRPKAATTLAAVQAASIVIAGNDLLADWASQIARAVVVIPSCVDPDDYVAKTDYVVADPPRLGWLGSPPTEVQLRTITAPLLEIHRTTGARLTVVSRGAAPLGPLDDMVDRVTWSPDRMHTLPATWDIGLMPMPAGLFDRAKCGYKLLQYGAVGLPMAGSPVGVNDDILARFGAPRPADDGEWVDVLRGMLDAAPSGREATAQRASAAVREGYTYARWRDTWRSAVGLG
jgi:hypothetical protein